MSSFWAKFTEPLPTTPVKPNNASAIFGGHSPYGLRAAEPSIFRSKEKPSTTRKSARSNSDAGLTKSSDKQKSKDSSSKRKLSESRSKSSSTQNTANKNRPVSPRSNAKGGEEEPEEDNLADSFDSSGSNGDRYPLFISVKKGLAAAAPEVKPRKPANGLNGDKPQEQSSNTQNQKEKGKIKRSSSFSSSRKTSESVGGSSLKSPQHVKSRGTSNQQIGIPSKGRSPIDSFRREKSDIIVRPRGSSSPSSNRKENLVLSNSKRSDSPSALKREKSDISKRSDSPSALRREKSDISKGSNSPSALRREKSDISKGSNSPSALKREKSDISKGSNSPSALRREKSDISKGSNSPSALRREKSDISKGSNSPSALKREKSDISKGSNSPSALKREKSDVTPRRAQQPPFGVLRENSDLVRPRGSPSPGALRREKSDIVSPRRSPGIGKRQKSDISLKKKPSTTPNSSTDTINSFESHSEGLTKVIHHKEIMSKIPTPAGTNPPSKIPSFTKISSIPQPKSKIPSIGKADKKEESSQKSQIPTGIPRSDKSTSKIPAPRPDSAKENKDPEINRKDSEEEGSKVKNDIKVSRIPSAKGASKIPWQDSHGKKSTSAEDDTDNVFADEHEVVANGNATEKVLTQSKIPSRSGGSQSSNIPTGVSKIPSFSKTTAPSKPSSIKPPEVVSPGSKIPQSGIPSPTVHAKPETGHSGIPAPTVHAKPDIGHSGIPAPTVHAKPETGIRKPEAFATGIPKPDVKTTTPISGIPKPEVKASPTTAESKIPQFSPTESTPKSKIPGPPGSLLTRKLSEEKFKKTNEVPVEKTAATRLETSKEETPVKPHESSGVSEVISAPAATVASPGKVAPLPPPRHDVKEGNKDAGAQKDEEAQPDSPMDEYIFSEAKRMEELLRNESIVVEVPKEEAEKPKGVEAKTEVGKLNFKKAPEAKEMVTAKSEVCEESKKETAKKEPVLFSTFGKKEEPVATDEKSVPKESPKVVVKQEAKKEALAEKEPDGEKAQESKEMAVDVQSPTDESKPAIDTLGQYEQQARRSRSRQRKVISPDSEQPETTFEQAASEDDAKKTIDKDKFGTQPFEGEETKDSQAKAGSKPTKGKSKHDKPKFVIESSLGADFYQSKSSQSKESITEDTGTKPSEVIVIENETFDDSKAAKTKDTGSSKKNQAKEKKGSEEFEDVDLGSNKGSKMEMRAWSMEQLDEKTVKCACGRGGKCSIM